MKHRFLQLTSEGHNNDWQNYLRSQAGNTTTVNLVICTVDYLLRLQESMMDFYWYYSRKDVIDPAGKANLFKAGLYFWTLFGVFLVTTPCLDNVTYRRSQIVTVVRRFSQCRKLVTF